MTNCLAVSGDFTDNVTKEWKMNKELRILCLIIIFITIAARPVNAQEPKKKTIEDALASYGLEEQKISILGNKVVIIEYKQQISEFGSEDEWLRKVANILAIVSDERSNAYLVKIQQHFDVGLIMEIIGKPEDGKAFLNNEISAEIFWLERLAFKPLTRGSPIVPGICEPDKGENCENCEGCVCYPNEVCAPANPQANKKGCVEKYAPPNAHLVGSEYVCDKGYEWSSDLTGCVPEKKCPQNAFKFQGDCYCDPGYESSSDSSECVQVGGGSTIPTAGKLQVPTASGSPYTEPVSSIIDQTLLLDSIPPSPWNQKNVFSPGDAIYVWIETKISNTPHKLEIVWINPSGKEIKREKFDLRGWGARETFWSELQTGRQMMQGRWKIELLIDGRVDRAMYVLFKP